MKKLAALILAFVLCLSACSSSSSETSTNEWLETAQLEAEETSDELYELALSEGVLTIYTVSSRIVDVAAAFEAEYPGLFVEVIYYRTEDMVSALETEKAADNVTSDLVFLTNGDGAITENLLPNELVHKYLPYDMANSMLDGLNEDYLSVMIEVPMLVYSSEYFSSAPVSNLWELTEETWYDKVYITNPADSMISYTFIAMLEQNSDLLEDAYASYFGSEYVADEGIVTYFLSLLLQNALHVVNDSDDVANGIEYGEGTIGLMNASKIRYNEDGYHFALTYNLEPFSGVANSAAIMMVDGAKNVSSAKLFIRYILGESTGDSEGLALLMNNEGIWPSRTDVTYLSEPLENFEVEYTDESFSYDYRDEFLELWEVLLTKYY